VEGTRYRDTRWRISSSGRMVAQRGLYGYRVFRKVGGKRYKSSAPGLIGQWGRRIGPTAFLIPDEHAKDVRELLRSRRCKFKEVPIWLEAGE